MEGDIITLQDIFRLLVCRGRNCQSARSSGSLQPTGLRPKIIEKLQDKGINVPPASSVHRIEPPCCGALLPAGERDQRKAAR